MTLVYEQNIYVTYLADLCSPTSSVAFYSGLSRLVALLVVDSLVEAPPDATSMDILFLILDILRAHGSMKGYIRQV